MSGSISRRRLLQSTAVTGAMLGIENLGFLSNLRPVSAAETKLDANLVRLDPSIEPIVRMIETTPREDLLEEVARRIHGGLSYRELLAALQLAGVKNVEPRPSVGFKFHSVLVVNSAHLASLSSPAEHRWLPIFWALDYYKSAAARDVQERGDWTMSGVKESDVPTASKAKKAFIQAMDNWDEAAADTAIAGLARTASSNEIYEMLFQYGTRDFRSIGHKAIYVANSYRTLNCIGWQHAEPVLRSLVYALLMHEDGNPAKRDDKADQPYRRNQSLVKTIRSDWRAGKVDSAATQSLLETLRTADVDQACDAVVKLLNAGISPQSVWDALFVASGELLMRQPGIIALHAVTSTNAIRFAYQTTASDETRRLLMLQNAAFLVFFREAMPGRGKVKDISVDDLTSIESTASKQETIETIFATLGSDPMQAAQTTLGFLSDTTDSAIHARELINAARVLVFLKGRDAHDYKFSSAILEDYYHISPKWRELYLASNLFKLKGSHEKDNQLVSRTRTALAS
ncbi:MAG: hypothetical protein COA78_11870 [Blastopirellula sp.]|nr:MAG: hypothetical protein COA78_11870 [Blastopirellula sp.]